MPTAELDAAAVAPWLGVLDEEERARAGRMVAARARVEFIAAHALARLEIADVLGGSPAALGFVAEPHGKPRAVLAGKAAPVSFSLSHGGGMVGVALAARGDLPLGLDLEAATRRISLEVARRFFAPSEIATLEAAPAARRAELLVRLWVLKEAFVKATGRGIGGGLDGFAFARWAAPGRRAELSLPGAEGEPGESWRFFRHSGGGFLAALAVRCGEPLRAPDWRCLAPTALGRRLASYSVRSNSTNPDGSTAT